MAGAGAANLDHGVTLGKENRYDSATFWRSLGYIVL